MHTPTVLHNEPEDGDRQAMTSPIGQAAAADTQNCAIGALPIFDGPSGVNA